MSFSFDPNSSGRGSLERNLKDIVKVKTDTLDNILPPSSIKANNFIIKIDVEEHDGRSQWHDRLVER